MAEGNGQPEKKLSAADRKKQIKKANQGATDEQVEQLYREELAQEKRDRFERVAVRRANQTAKALDNLARVGNRNIYGYTDEQAEKVLEHIERHYRSFREAFSGVKAEDEAFSL